MPHPIENISEKMGYSEENSFYHPYKFDKSLMQLIEQQAKDIRQSSSYYLDYLYDDKENCTIVKRSIDDTDEIELDENGQIRKKILK